MRQLIRLVGRCTGYLIGVILILMGCFCLLWAIQSASFSVAAEPLAQAIYQTRAEIMLPLGLLSLATGVLYFYVLLRTQNLSRKSELD
ncbi:MAG: hypothetical protein AB1586_21180 [Pseudomonadota bacterium]